MNRRIVGFHQDDEDDWVARLECGHHQHTRHRPPRINRPWVTTQQGRADALGQLLDCRKCEQNAPPDVAPGAPG